MRAMWIFRDDLERGLEHGRHYHIRKEVLKNGKVRVTVEETRQKLTFKDAFDFARHFQVK
jgi:hypothetical protein